MKRLLIIPLLLASCTPLTDEFEEQAKVPGTGDHTVTFRPAFPTSFTRADIGEVASRLSFAVFYNGERVKTTEHQEVGVDDDFGTYKLKLDKGVYELVVIAHNGSGNCTITSPEKVTFKNSLVSDTFCGYTQFRVADNDTTISLDMQRVVARIDFTSTSNHTSDVSKLRFYYKGGSSTLNAKTMQGCVQSRQSVTLDAVTPDHYTLYTFPYMSSTSTLNMTVYSMDAQSNDIDETTFSNIPVEVRRTTTVSASLFDKHMVTVTIPDQAVQWGENITINL